MGIRRADDLRQADAAGISRIRRRPLGHQSQGFGTGRARSPVLARIRAASARALRRIFQGHAPEGRARRRVGARPAADHPRRAPHRPRRRLRASRQGIARGTGTRRLHRDHDHAYPGSRRTHGRPDRRDRIGPAGRRRHTGRAAPAERTQRHQSRGHVHRAGRYQGCRGMSSAAALTWFARHEIRLAWREWLAMMTAGRKGRKRAAIIGLTVFAAVMHLPAYAVIGRFADLQAPLDKSTLIVITATVFLAWALMLSQAIESVTRVFYARADLDLIMSSPVTLANVFSVRIAAIALSVVAMALLLSTPFVDVLVIGGGIRWFAAFGVVIAIGLSAAAVAVAVTIVLFRLIGPSRTPLVAQILAAIVGAGFVIALQIAAILSYGTLSRFAVLTSDAAAGFAPDLDSMLWWPARAMLGDGEALLCLLALGLIMLGVTMAIYSPRFADHVIRVSAT